MLLRHGTTKRYSDSTVYNGVAYLVEVPTTDDGGIVAQTESLFASLDKALKVAGTSKERLLQVQVFLVDIADYAGFNEAWDRWMPEGCAPSRACIEVKGLANPAWRVELVVTAAVQATD